MEYDLSHYRIKKFSNNILLTNDYGGYIFLNNQEFDEFKSHKLSLEKLLDLKEKGFILQENSDDLVNKYREKNLNLFRGTSLHIIVPTLRCNFNCSYCHAKSKSVDSKDYDLDEKTAKQTVDFIFQTPTKSFNIEFQGGEPLLNFKIIQFIVEYVKLA